ncbi:MAG: diguanylate cyclase [Vulcanimicrobiota bacterium]
MRRLSAALEKSQDPLSRAETHRQLALLNVTFGDSTRAVAHLRSAFAELGIRKAASPFGRALSSVGHLLGFGANRVPAEAGIRLAVVACRACLAEGHVGEAIEALAVGTKLARRVELCPSLVLLTSMQAVALAGGGWLGAAERRQAQAERMAEQLGDPSVQAQLGLTRTFYLRTRGDEVAAAANSEECLLERGAWLATPDYLLMCGDLAHNLHFRGLPGPSRDWLDFSVKRARHENYPFTVIGPIAPTMAMLGRPAEARDQLERNNPPADASPLRLATHLEARLHLLLESGELGQEADRIIEEFDNLGLYIQTAPIQVRAFFILEGYARLRQSEAGPIRHQELKKALGRLARDRKLPLFRASHDAIEAGYERLCGRLGRAERLLIKADELARRHDNLVVRVEVARQRAWILQARGHQQAAWREARLAASMAAEVGWLSAAQTLERQFGLERRSASFDSSGSGSSQSAMTLRLQRHLEALLEVTSAAHQTFDPVALGQLMLKELLRLFGAERAYLFLDERGQLTFQAGLSSAGQTLEAGGDYSRTVIERVARTGEPLLLSGTDEGEVLGSASVVAHDLRSIVAVPLALRDRSLGVVYLDSRLARGVFGPDDVSILQALAYQVAVTLEMARSASLEVQVRAEREQRRLAEQLSEFIGTILPLLEQEAILACTLDLLESLTGYESAYVMLATAGQFEAGPVRGQPVSSLEGAPLELVGEGVSLFSAWLKGGRSRLGMVVLERASDRPFTRREQELTLACLGYAGMAIENARLFADVERLATTDELTGANNRRHFFARAEEEFRRADRLGHSLCLALFDIDHFKKFNDTYGHAVGDLVLSTTSKRCQACLRSIDIMGRYGGEEFAVVLVGTGLDDAVATADRLRRAVGDEPFDTPHGPLQVSISLGVALRGSDEAVETVLERADQALYRAKDAGRNRVERG